ncbi:hypothetical protein SDC9_102036 [bioreactor metagenome]|uniref:Uncharacterized protein n=1 Tax=bioreactor metagenome TaxID=1076179 RepID=A0A645AWF9_9ZZZZ
MFENPVATYGRGGVFFLVWVWREGLGFGLRFPAKTVWAGNLAVSAGDLARRSSFGGFSSGVRN